MDLNSVTPELVSFLKTQEGCRLLSYPDSGGVYTLAYGITEIDGKPVVKGQRCNQAQADKWLTERLQHSANIVNATIKVAIPVRCFYALVSFCFNTGDHAFETSTLAKLVNEGRMNEASLQFSAWDHDDGKVVKGLVQRRANERALFVSGLAK